MRSFSVVLSSFWTGETGKRLRKSGPETQVVAMYLITSGSSNMIGLYYIPIPLIAYETGLTFEGASKGLRRAIEGGFCHFDEKTETVWIPEMAKIQIGEKLKHNDKRIIGIEKILKTHHKSPFFNEFLKKYKDDFCLNIQFEKVRGFEGASKGHRSQEQEQDLKKEIYKEKSFEKLSDEKTESSEKISEPEKNPIESISISKIGKPIQNEPVNGIFIPEEEKKNIEENQQLEEFEGEEYRPEDQKGSIPSAEKIKRKTFEDKFMELFEYWKIERKKPRALPSDDRRKAVKARLDDGYTVEDIKLGIKGIALSKHHMGDNDRKTIYDDLFHVCSSGKNLDNFIALECERLDLEAKIAVQENVRRKKEEIQAIETEEEFIKMTDEEAERIKRSIGVDPRNFIKKMDSKSNLAKIVGNLSNKISMI